jgi:hypothetical protein
LFNPRRLPLRGVSFAPFSRRVVVALLTCSLALGAVHGGHVRTAQAAGGDEATAAALQKFDAGRQAFEKGAFEEALLAFQASYALLPSPNSRLFAARCYRALGKVAKAYTTFRLASREAQDRLTATGEKRYSATRDAASSEAAELEPKVPRLTLVVPGGVPDGYSIRENGEEVPKAAWGVAVETDAGTITITATGPRLVPFTKELTLAAGAQERVDVDVKKLPTAVITLALKTRPAGASISLDGTAIDPGDAEKPREVDVGEHVVAVDVPGYVPFQWKQTLADGDRAAVDVTMKVETQRGAGAKGTPKWLFVATTVGAVGALGAATAIALDAQSKSNAQQALQPVARDPAVKSTVGSLSTVANVLFVTGGVFGVGAGVLVFTTKRHSDAPPTEHATLAPWVTQGSGGLALTGRF